MCHMSHSQPIRYRTRETVLFDINLNSANVKRKYEYQRRKNGDRLRKYIQNWIQLLNYENICLWTYRLSGLGSSIQQDVLYTIHLALFCTYATCDVVMNGMFFFWYAEWWVVMVTIFVVLTQFFFFIIIIALVFVLVF